MNSRTLLRHVLAPAAAAALVVSAMAGCMSPPGAQEQVAPGAEPSAGEVVLDEHGEPAGLHRHHRWSEKLGQGAQPAGAVAFRNLKALGYTTVLSVDGAIPDLENAHANGLRYVHVPIGYDGVPPEAALTIVKAVRESEGPVYVHCHHGKHRGPAGAMIARIGVDGIDNEQALAELAESECSPKYTGLYRDVGAFVAPTAEQVAAADVAVVEVVRPAGVTESMVHISHRWEGVKLIREASWSVPPQSPDIDPPHEATMLWEHFREMARLDESKEYGETFLKYLAESEKAADALQAALRAGDGTDAQKAYDSIKKSCNDCHTVFRN